MAGFYWPNHRCWQSSACQSVLVIGAGVAGLGAIGTAQSLGAIVRAFDVRPEVAEQIESMGAEFLMLEFEEDGSGEGRLRQTSLSGIH